MAAVEKDRTRQITAYRSAFDRINVEVVIGIFPAARFSVLLGAELMSGDGKTLVLMTDQSLFEALPNQFRDDPTAVDERDWPAEGIGVFLVRIDPQ